MFLNYKLLFDKCHVSTLVPVLMTFLPISFFPGLIQTLEKEMPGKYTVVTDLWNKAGHIS